LLILSAACRQNTVIFELKTRVDELKMENAYQLRLRDVSYNEKIKELTEKFVQDMEQLKTKIAVRRCTIPKPMPQLRRFQCLKCELCHKPIGSLQLYSEQDLTCSRYVTCRK